MSVRSTFSGAAAALGVCAVLFVTGCASNKPVAEVTRARTLIEQAEKAGAQQYAPVELDQARNKLRLADAALEDGKDEEARARANEAAAGAELAQAKASSGAAGKAAAEVQQSTETLRREAQRGEVATTPGAGTVSPPPQTVTPPQL
jgi:hypothetical protein